MKILTTKSGIEVMYYASSKELTTARYTQFQKHAIMDMGVGSDMESVSNHFARLHTFQANAELDAAKKEAENLHYNFFTILNGVNFACSSFACLIHSIGGEVMGDLSEEGISRVVEKLNTLEITQLEIEMAVDAVKKKLNEEYRMYFPLTFPDSEVIDFYIQLKKQVELLGEYVDADTPETKALAVSEVLKIKNKMTPKPMVFTGDDPDNVLVTLERDFGSLCSLLENNGITAPGNLTCFDFYSRIEYLKRTAPKS